MTTVTQADREAVAAFHSASFTALFDGGDEINKAQTLLLEAFAAHREAAEQAGAKAMQEAAAKEAKTAWVSADYNVVGIADADMAMRLCEHAEATIAALDPAQITGGGK